MSETQANDPESVARAIVLRQLTAAAKTRSQLAAALRRKGIPDEAATRVLDRFTELRLVDDEAFADAWVESRHRAKGHGPQLLRRELENRGVDRDTAAHAVSVISPDSERDAAARIVRSRLARTESLEPRKRRQRLVAMLVRKGYGYPVAAAAVDEAIGASEESEFPC